MSAISQKKLIRVLTRGETQRWHSPFSKILRESHQTSIIHGCAQAAKSDGREGYAIFDAYENLVASGLVIGE